MCSNIVMMCFQLVGKKIWVIALEKKRGTSCHENCLVVLEGRRFGMLFGFGDFPLDRFLRHVSYMILVDAKARGRCWREI